MKRILKSIAIVAAAAMSFAACQKEVAPQEKTEQGLYKYTFNVVDGEAKVDAETKAILGDSNVEWVSGDQVGVFIADNANYANMDVTGTPVKAVLYSNSVIPAGTMVYGFYPYNDLNKTSEDYSNNFALISFAAAQHGKSTSSMPLAGVPFEVQEELAASAKTGNGELKFLNLGSIVNFKVWSANQDEQSETVQYIVFTANDNAKIAGDAVIDLTAVDPANASTLAVTFMDGVSSVKVEQESSVASAKGSGEGVKMVIAPGTFSGTLKVGTDAHTYYFDIPEITFNRSAQRSINVNLVNAVIKEGVDLDAKALPYEEKFDVGMGEFTVEDITNPDGVTVWSHSNQNGSYMKATAYINSQRYETESMLVSPWIDLTTVQSATISFDHAVNYTSNMSDKSAYLSLWTMSDEQGANWQKLTIPNYGAGNSWSLVASGDIDLSAYCGKNVKIAFKYISGGTKDDTATWEIKNFKVDKVKSEAGLAYAIAEYTANVGEDFTAPTLTNPNNLTVTYSSSNENVALVDEATGEIVIGEAGVAVITASFAGNDDYYEGSASYTIKVTDPNQTTITDVITLATTGVSGTSYSAWTGKTSLSDAVYAGNSAGGNNAIQLRSSNSNSGIVTTASGGYAKQITLTWNTNTAETRTVEIYGKNTAYTSASDLYDSSKQGTSLGSYCIDDASNKISIASIAGNYQFIGIRSKSGALYIDKIEIEWSAEAAATYAVNIGALENGTITASKVSGIGEGESVTLTVSPASGYQLESLIVDNENVTSLVSGKKYTFNMPAKNVDVTASFSKLPTYSISIDASIANGEISATKTTDILEGEVVILTVTPDSGYALGTLTVGGVDVTESVSANKYSFEMPANDVAVTATFVVSSGTTATINFSKNDTAINSESVTGTDSEGNTWNITTAGTTSFTANTAYYQVGSSSKPATSITFTTTLPDGASVSGISAKFGGFSGTAGDVNLKVGDISVGTGSLNATNDVIVESTSTASGNVITITVTNISKGVKVYYISVTY